MSWKEQSREWARSAGASGAYQATIDDWPESVQMLRGTIGLCRMYPIKSLGSLTLTDGMRVTRQGLRTVDNKLLDRALMLAIKKQNDDSGMSVGYARFSQRQDGCLAQVVPSYDGRILRYQAPHMRDLIIYPQQLRAVASRRDRVRMASDGDEVLPVSLEDGPITDWIREYMGKARSKVDPRDIVVLTMLPNFTRNVETQYARGTFAEMQFTDDSVGLLASETTVIWMNQMLRLQTGASFQPIDIDVFRPNVTLYGLPPNMEDVLDAVRVEDGPMLLCTKMCVRCIATHVDQDTGVKRMDGQPLKFLSEHRPHRPDKPKGATFGINWLCDHQSEGRILRAGQHFSVRVREL